MSYSLLSRIILSYGTSASSVGVTNGHALSRQVPISNGIEWTQMALEKERLMAMGVSKAPEDVLDVLEDHICLRAKEAIGCG